MDAELFRPFKLAFTILKKTGMWQDGKQSWSYFILGHLSILAIIQVLWLLYLIFALKAQNVEDFVEASGYVASQTAEMFKFWNFYFKLSRIENSVETLARLIKFSADNRWKSRNGLKSWIALELKIHKAFWFSAWITCLIGAFMPFLKHQLPFKAWFPFDTEHNEFGFWSASTFLIIVLFPMSAIDITLDMLPVIFLTFAIGLTDELSERLNEIGNVKNNEQISSQEKLEMEKELVKCIIIHKKIKEFIKEINENFSTAIFLQGFISSTILCASAYTTSKVKFV